MTITDVTREAMSSFIRDTGGRVASQLEACTRCGICAEACHFYVATGNPDFVPIWKVELLQKAYRQQFTLLGRLRTAIGVERRVDDDDIEKWAKLVYEACTVCNKCSLVCPMGIDLGPLIFDVRKGMSAAGMVPEDLEALTRKQLEEGSPLGVTDDVFADRLDWISDEWDIDLPIDKADADTLVVFSSIEIMKFPDNLASIAKILDAAGENWTLSSTGREVVDFAFFEGSPEHMKILLNRVLDAARDLGVKRIIVTECGHAYEALRWVGPDLVDYPDDLEVVHITGLMSQYVKSGKLKLRPGSLDDKGPITYHDSCKIQRLGGYIDDPRKLLGVMAPQSFVEMTPSHEQSICCGGGGGVNSVKAADANRKAVFRLKVDQLDATGAKTVVMSCSNCRLNFLDGVDQYNVPVEIKGLAGLVADSLETAKN